VKGAESLLVPIKEKTGMMPTGMHMPVQQAHVAPAPLRTFDMVFPAVPAQVGQARRFLRAALEGCPQADDAVLCLSELASNSVLHSNSRKPGGTFTVRATSYEGDYVYIEVEDHGGPWQEPPHRDGRPHGLDIIRALAADCGTDGNALTGWIAWARLDWPASARPPAPGPATAAPSRPPVAATNE
jgi:serine/threonine-protein kinase RsbW